MTKIVVFLTDIIRKKIIKIYLKNPDISDFKRRQIVFARMTDAIEIKTDELFVVARTTVSKVLVTFEKR